MVKKRRALSPLRNLIQIRMEPKPIYLICLSRVVGITPGPMKKSRIMSNMLRNLVLLQETICGSTKITNILIAGLLEKLFRMTGNLNGEKKLKRSNDNISLSDFFKTELEFCESLHDFWERRLSSYSKGHI